MICATSFLIEHLRAQANLEKFAEKIGVSRPTLYKTMEGHPVSNQVMSAILKETGLDMAKAFEVKE